MSEQELQGQVAELTSANEGLKKEKADLEQKLADMAKKYKEYKERWLHATIQTLLDEHDATINPKTSAQLVITSTD